MRDLDAAFDATPNTAASGERGLTLPRLVDLQAAYAVRRAGELRELAYAMAVARSDKPDKAIENIKPKLPPRRPTNKPTSRRWWEDPDDDDGE